MLFFLCAHFPHLNPLTASYYPASPPWHAPPPAFAGGGYGTPPAFYASPPLSPPLLPSTPPAHALASPPQQPVLSRAEAATLAAQAAARAALPPVPDFRSPPRTTLMLRNIPNKYTQVSVLCCGECVCVFLVMIFSKINPPTPFFPTLFFSSSSQQMLMATLDALGLRGTFDFIYLPLDFKNR